MYSADIMITETVDSDVYEIMDVTVRAETMPVLEARIAQQVALSVSAEAQNDAAAASEQPAENEDEEVPVDPEPSVNSGKQLNLYSGAPSVGVVPSVPAFSGSVTAAANQPLVDPTLPDDSSVDDPSADSDGDLGVEPDAPAPSYDVGQSS